MGYKSINVLLHDKAGILRLNRPEVNNALNREMIIEIIDAMDFFNNKPEIRFVIIEGNGKMFCSGADLNWMKNASELTDEENFNDSLLLAQCIYKIYSTQSITIAKIHGGAYGGGIGLAAACDFAFTGSDAVFSFSEAKLGLLPAVILPYIIKRIGVLVSKQLMLTGKKFNGKQAKELGLTDEYFNTEKELAVAIDTLISELNHAAPLVQKQIKSLINSNSVMEINENLLKTTSEILAKARLTDESKEGMEAFLQKRDPNWLK